MFPTGGAMANEQGGGEPLAASVGEQVERKQALDERAEAERQEAKREAQRVERRKADEREEVEKHLGPEAATPEGWRAARDEARARGRRSAWLRDWGRVLAL